MSQNIKKFIEALRCPISKGKLVYREDEQDIYSPKGGVAYPITQEGIPVLLEESAYQIEKVEIE